MAATEGVEKALVADLAPEGLHTAFDWSNLIAGIMLLPASILFGWLYQQISPSIAFSFSGGCAMLAAALLFLWMKPAHQHQLEKLVKSMVNRRFR